MTRLAVAVVIAASVVGIAACHSAPRTAAIPATASSPAAQEHCWWAVYRSPLDADSVVLYYTRAFERVGLTNVHHGSSADTAWADAGPTPLGGGFGGWTYAARIVAYQHGDTAHFRTFVSQAPPANASPVSDSSRALGNNPEAGRHIAFCAQLARLAQVGGTAPREPDGEEKWDVWRARGGNAVRAR